MTAGEKPRLLTAFRLDTGPAYHVCPLRLIAADEASELIRGVAGGGGAGGGHRGGWAGRECRRERMSGSAGRGLGSPLSLRTRFLGVAAGARRPNQPSAS